MVYSTSKKKTRWQTEFGPVWSFVKITTRIVILVTRIVRMVKIVIWMERSGTRIVDKVTIIWNRLQLEPDGSLLGGGGEYQDL